MTEHSSGTPSSEATVVRSGTGDRYELRLDDRTIGYAQYHLTDGGSRIVFTHTEVDDDYAGRGLGKTLARFALDDAKAQALHVSAECPYIAHYIRKHPEYDDVLDIAPGLGD